MAERAILVIGNGLFVASTVAHMVVNITSVCLLAIYVFG